MNDETQASTPSLEQIKAGMRATWMAGDFGVIARNLANGAAEFAGSLDLLAGKRVLDVATGTGNVALPLAQAGCIVTGVDIAPNLLEQARERAREAGLSVAFDEGDAEQLPYPDASFDAVVTMFGAMFAPRPDVVAAELARVLRPGGLLAMANWNPESFTGKMFRVGARHVPPPAGLPAPVLWGDEESVTQRLSTSFEEIRTKIVPIDFVLNVPAQGAVDVFRTYFGPTRMAFSRLDESGQAALAADLVSLWAEANVSPEPQSSTLVPNEYLRVTARRR